VAANTQTRRRAEGVTVRHARHCPTGVGGACSCRPAFQAQVFSPRDHRTIRKSFPTLSDARAWRAATQTQVRHQTLRAPTRTTLREAAEQWLEAAKVGAVRTRSGEPYKPSALRSYEHALKQRVLPALGHLKLSAVGRNDIQDLADRLSSAGLAASTVRNAILPLRAIYRRATARQDIALNPTLGLALPAVRGRRDRVARPHEAAQLIAAAPPGDRAVWATALYAGLRRGELQALDWQQIDLDHGLIHVERGWDREQGPIEPKSRAGRRRVPIPTTLRRQLQAHRLHQGRGATGLAFGRTPTLPFDPSVIHDRARRAWKHAGLAPIGLHECRHTYAAHMIAAGINPKALSQYMGHSSITITLDRYGHLMPGAEHQAATMLDDYLLSARG
jgi:integrase